MADLGDLGLSDYESRVYRSLLQTDPTTARELSIDSGVPMGRIYDVLESLETLGLVRAQSASRPKKYVAVDPAAGLDRLLEERKRQLTDRAEQYETVAEELKERLDTEQSVDTFWTAAVGPEETIELFVERLDAATDRIVVVGGDPGGNFDIGSLGKRVTNRLEAAADRGVSVEVLVSERLVDSVPASVFDRYTGGLTDRESFAVRLSDGVEGSFILVDETEVCIEVPHPLDRGEPFAMIDLEDRAFAAEAHDSFERRWTEATPL